MIRGWVVRLNVLESILHKVQQPFASWDAFLAGISGGVRAVSDLNSVTGWFYLLTGVTIAWVLYALDRRRALPAPPASFRAFAFPRGVYTHPSAIVDYKFVALDLTVKGVLYLPLVSGVGWFVSSQLLDAIGGPAQPGAAGGVAGAVVFIAVMVLAADFGGFIQHYLMHKIPFLWHFHTVHHSAEVLTPLTVYRVHPVEDLASGVMSAVLGAIGATVYSLSVDSPLTPTRAFVSSIVTFLFFSCAFQLRHTHIWLSYGPVLSRIFISPAQHQIHHSMNDRHWNRNFGFMFAFWDLLFGSLYVPRQRETLRFGIPGADPRDYSSVAKLYFLPFAKAARSLLPGAADTTRRATAARSSPASRRGRTSGA